MIFCTIINKLRIIYRRIFLTPEIYARKIGVKIGHNCFICTRYFGSEPYLITIGNNVQVTDNVKFHTHGGAHVIRKKIPCFDVFGKIIICDWAYIGADSHIMPGVTIGENSLIAAGSIVTKSVPANEVWGGVPARKISSIAEYMKKNLPYNTNTKGLSYSEKREVLMSMPESMFIKR